MVEVGTTHTNTCIQSISYCRGITIVKTSVLDLAREVN